MKPLQLIGFLDSRSKTAAIAQLKALWEQHHAEGPTRSERALRKKEASRTLHFDTPQEAREHMHLRNTAAKGLGALAGGAYGAHVGHGRFGTKGAIGGALLGAGIGTVAGSTAYDTAHAVPDRTARALNETQARLQAASGGATRIASASPTAEDFTEFAQQDQTHSATSKEREQLAPHEQDPRLQPAMWGSPGSLEGGDVGTRTQGLALPAYGGV